jgi:hypothetical protein
MLTGNQRRDLEGRVVTFSQSVKDLTDKKKSISSGYNAEIKEIKKRLDAILEALKTNDEGVLCTKFGEHWEKELLPAPAMTRKG